MKQRGFTLIEIIIALAVFAIIASITAYALAQSFDIDKRLKSQAFRRHQLELAVILLRRETAQIINRPVRGNDQSLFPGLIAHSDGVEFTRSGDVNPDATAQRATLKRVAYLCYGHRFIRRSWPLLDAPDRSAFQSQIILDHVSACSFTYRDTKHQSHSEWRIQPGDRSQQIAQLPASIICHLTLEHLGALDLVLPLPPGMYG